MASRPSLTNEELLKQIQAMLGGSDDDPQKVFLKEMLLGVLKLHHRQLDTLDIKILNRTLKELRYAFKVFHPYRHRPKVSLFGSARTQSDDPNYRLAYRFARLLARRR